MSDPLPWDQFEQQSTVFPDQQHPVLVIGAGLAGCWIARTLAEAGVAILVVDAASKIAAGGSSNPAGIVKPFVTRHPGLAMMFYAQAHQYLLERLDSWGLRHNGDFNACGVVQLVDKPYPDSTLYQNICGRELHSALGVTNDGYGLLFVKSGWLNPSALCHCLLDHPLIAVRNHCKVHSITSGSDAKWRLDCADGSTVEATQVVIANGVSLPDFTFCSHLPLIPARGQISRFTVLTPANMPRHVINGRHYVIPDGQSVIVGATFDRNSTDTAISEDDNKSNLAGLSKVAPALAVNPNSVSAYAGIRATTPDRLPFVGPLFNFSKCNDVYNDIRHGRKLAGYPSLPIHRGVFMLGGLGSRGIVTAPFAAHLLGDYMLGGNLINQWSPLINPARFLIRQLKRGVSP